MRASGTGEQGTAERNMWPSEAIVKEGVCEKWPNECIVGMGFLTSKIA